jgi:hypothetical protein
VADVVEIWADQPEPFVKGKRHSRKPGFVPPEPEPVVTLIHPAKIDAFLGSRTRSERVALLRRLRDEGRLIHSKDRLQQAVRGQGVRRAYVFRGCEAEVPRVEKASGLAPVTTKRGKRVGTVGEIRMIRV